MERRCTFCKEPIAGRTDKKFCNDQCRSSFNNRLRNPINLFVRQTNRQLLQNRQLLATCYRKKIIQVKRDWLVQKGFSFSHVTHVLQDPQGAFYHCCYDHAYTHAGTDVLVMQIGGNR